jgi:antitoxin component YwqK of YwqJK toxin-antitoxin module
MTSKGKPSMHFALNEAWILSGFTGEVNQQPGNDSSGIKPIEEKYDNGKPRIISGGFVGKNGFVLHGNETWFYDNGAKQYEASFNKGVLEGMETYWGPDGKIKWTRDHTPYGISVWTNYWSNGAKRSVSTWWGLTATGPATSWDRDGKVLHQIMFEEGRRVVTEAKSEIQE